MVYCGKASQGCQNCRTRRIKCDKVKPECSQCIRVGKKCPGYRDQLSLMFRDESSKVRQKAHAQWGTAASPEQTSPPISFATASVPAIWAASSPASSSSSSSTEGQSPDATTSPASSTTAVTFSGRKRTASPPIYIKVEPDIEQRGVQFFLDNYLMNHPDSPVTSDQLRIYGGGSEAMQNIMKAVGLAGLSNIHGDKELNLLSRQKYTMALKQTSQLIASKHGDPRMVYDGLRAAVTLALFEVVQGGGSKLSTGTANVHIFGGLALLRSSLPVRSSPFGGARAVLQLMFSLFIPSQVTDNPLPPAYFESLKTCRFLLPPSEQCACDIALGIARFLHVSSLAKNMQLMDGQPATEDAFRQYLSLDDLFARLEEPLQEAYPFVTVKGEDFPPMAVFRGKYQVHHELWGARIWNHFRWARILVNQCIIELSDRCPESCFKIITATRRKECFDLVKKMAEDILISVPANWTHPALTTEQGKKLAAVGKGGSGAVGLPTLLWHLKIAGCAPGVPDEFWEWAHATIEVVWKNMGMQHALALSEVMQGHRAGQESEIVEKIQRFEADREKSW